MLDVLLELHFIIEKELVESLKVLRVEVSNSVWAIFYPDYLTRVTVDNAVLVLEERLHLLIPCWGNIVEEEIALFLYNWLVFRSLLWVVDFEP